MNAQIVARLQDGLLQAAMAEANCWRAEYPEGHITSRSILPCLFAGDAALRFPAMQAVAQLAVDQSSARVRFAAATVHQPGGGIGNHRDHHPAGPMLTVALQIGAGCDFYYAPHAGAEPEVIKMKAGEIWSWNATATHGVYNRSNIDRIVILLGLRGRWAGIERSRTITAATGGAFAGGSWRKARISYALTGRRWWRHSGLR